MDVLRERIEEEFLLILYHHETFEEKKVVTAFLRLYEQFLEETTSEAPRPSTVEIVGDLGSWGPMEDPVPIIRGTAMSPEPQDELRHVRRLETPPATQGTAARPEVAGSPSAGEETRPSRDELDPQRRWQWLRERLEGNCREFRKLCTRINAAFEELTAIVAEHSSTKQTKAWEEQCQDVPTGIRAFAGAIAESRAVRAEEARRRDETWERACLCQEEAARIQREMCEHLQDAGIPPKIGGRRTTQNCYVCGHPGVRNSYTCPNRENHRRVRGRPRAEDI